MAATAPPILSAPRPPPFAFSCQPPPRSPSLERVIIAGEQRFASTLLLDSPPRGWLFPLKGGRDVAAVAVGDRARSNVEIRCAGSMHAGIRACPRASITVAISKNSPRLTENRRFRFERSVAVSIREGMLSSLSFASTSPCIIIIKKSQEDLASRCKLEINLDLYRHLEHLLRISCFRSKCVEDFPPALMNSLSMRPRARLSPKLARSIPLLKINCLACREARLI